ncbi:MAG: 2-isopropylmalate synthase, partial [Clostridia bacterium]|nr:2-isopropylmalate synthase [Clostridia bacterium]
PLGALIFNMPRAGVLAVGVPAAAEIYSIFDTRKLLNRGPSVMIGKASGLAGIAYWINENYRLSPSEAVNKKDQLVIDLKAWIDEEYADGRQTSLSTAELEARIEELSGGKLRRL